MRQRAFTNARFPHAPLLQEGVEPVGIHLGHGREEQPGIGVVGRRQHVALGSLLDDAAPMHDDRSEEHTSELQSLMHSSYAVFCLKKKKNKKYKTIRSRSEQQSERTKATE